MATASLFSSIQTMHGDVNLCTMYSNSVNLNIINNAGYNNYTDGMYYLCNPNDAAATDFTAKFVEAYNNPNTNVTLLEIDANNAYYVQYTGHLLFYLKHNGSTDLVADWQNPYPVTTFTKTSIFCVQTDSYKTIGVYIQNSYYFPWVGTGTRCTSPTTNYMAEFISHLNAPPQYTWTAWDQISGNGGQYRCNLTKIKDDSITVDTTTTDGTESDFDRIGSQSSIWAIFQNMSVGHEKIVAWSGVNWMTLTLVDNGIPDTYSFVFRFYAPAISATAPFYTISRVITYGGSVPTRDMWLSFAYDEEQQAAVFLPVSYDTGTLQPGYEWGGVSATEDEMLYLYLWLQASGAGTPEYPYDTGTTDNGGNPGGPQPGDHMPTPGVPTLSGMSSGMFTVYNPTNTQLEQIGEFLWSANVIDNIRKYFNDFADNIIALYVLPCKLSNLPSKSFKVGNMQSDTITGVEYLTQRFTAVDMGSVYIKNVFDSYLDYSPFTKFELYLPGIGMQTLSADDIAAPTDPDTGTLKAVEGSTISLTYNIDLMTGLVVAMVKINGELKYQFPGKVGYSIPLTGANYTQMVTGFITAAAGLVGAAATGGLSAPLSAAGVGAAVSGTVNAMKPEIRRGGNLSGDVSSLSERTPYIICHRPNKPLLENQERYTGFPSYKSGTLSEFSGLTQVIDAHIEGISCTEAERAEILNLLKGGVIL